MPRRHMRMQSRPLDIDKPQKLVPIDRESISWVPEASHYVSLSFPEPVSSESSPSRQSSSRSHVECMREIK